MVAVTREEYQRAVAQLLQHHQVQGTPQEAAQGLLQAMPEEELLAEVYRDRVLTLVPLTDKGPLVPEAEAALKEKYLRWCQPRGGGDCLGLFTDGPYLRTDDRRTLALALAFGGVLDETRAALGRELSPQALLSSLVWAAGLYLALWLLPEPTCVSGNGCDDGGAAWNRAISVFEQGRPGCVAPPWGSAGSRNSPFGRARSGVRMPFFIQYPHGVPGYSVLLDETARGVAAVRQTSRRARKAIVDARCGGLPGS